MIGPHAGIVGGADLDPAVHGWTDPVMRVTIEKGAAPPALPDFIEALAADGRFTTLLTALDLSFVEPPPPGELFTLLAPTDNAFAALPEDLRNDLLADPGFLTDVLLYHLIEGSVSAADLAAMTEIRTLLGAPIMIDFSDDLVFLNNEAAIVDEDIAVDQGLIHGIDAVLLPPPPPESLGFLVADFGRGSTEVPDPGDPDALSLALIDVFEAEDGMAEICFFANTSADDPTVAHIHRGAAGVAGPVVVNTGFDPDSWAQDDFAPSDRFADGCVDVELDLAQEIIDDPGGFYFNIHSEMYPGGATREQLLDASELDAVPSGLHRRTPAREQRGARPRRPRFRPRFRRLLAAHHRQR